VFLLLVIILLGACGVPLDEHNAQIQTANLTIENLKATRVEGKAQIATNEAVMAEQALQIRTAQAGQEQVLTELNRLKGNYASLANKATQKARDYTEKAYALVEVAGTLTAYEEYYSPVPTATPTPTPRGARGFSVPRPCPPIFLVTLPVSIYDHALSCL
jgi:hypothetical protein